MANKGHGYGGDMIDINKRYGTRSGRQVRIYSVEAGGCAPVHGAVHDGKSWWPFCWDGGGKMIASADGPDPYDLIEEGSDCNATVTLN
jgi:hypothetical protein